MQRYDSYKDSGIQWLGEIPSHWEVCKIKNVSQISSGSTPKSSIERYWGGGIKWITPADFKTDTKYVCKGMRDITEVGALSCSTKLIPKNSVVFSKRAPVGQVSITTDDLCINQGCIACIPNESIITLFFFYLLSCYKDEFESLSGGTTFKEIALNVFADFKISIPPLPEQQAIASYLDTATAKIDEAIAQQQKMIDLLNERKQIIINNAVTKGLNPNAKMKPSGIDWIGTIPEHWEVKKLKHVCQAFGRIGFRGYSTTDLVDEGEGCITLSPSNMHDGLMQYKKCTYLSWEKYEESPEIKISNGDILFVKTGSTYGKSSLVHDLPLEATINPQLLVFKNFLCNNKFLAYVLQTNAVRAQVEVSVIGGTIPTISQQKILNYVFPYPTEDEQKAIVAYIEKKCIPINNAKNAAERQITLLQERKQIIINEIVTGKVAIQNK